MKTTGWMVVTATSNAGPMPKRKAEKIARWLREGKIGTRKVGAPVEAKVVAA